MNIGPAFNNSLFPLSLHPLLDLWTKYGAFQSDEYMNLLRNFRGNPVIFDGQAYHSNQLLSAVTQFITLRNTINPITSEIINPLGSQLTKQIVISPNFIQGLSNTCNPVLTTTAEDSTAMSLNDAETMAQKSIKKEVFQPETGMENIQSTTDSNSEKTQVEGEARMLKRRMEPQNDWKKDFWTPEKCDMLLKLAVQYRCDWKKVARKFNDRRITPFQVRSKHKELTIKDHFPLRVKFSHEEDILIAKLFTKFGNNWARISQYLPKRSSIMIKNRFYSYIRKKNLIESLLKEGENVKIDIGMDDTNHLSQSPRIVNSIHETEETDYQVSSFS